MALEGSLSVVALPEILQVISMQKKTGILTVQGENDIIAVSFEHGEVVAADALNQTVEEGLGQVLASEGLVSPSDFAQVAAKHQAGGQRLIDLILEQSLITRVQLLNALRVQTYHLLTQLLRWRSGDFKFYGGEEVSYEEGFDAIAVEELLLRSSEELGSEDGGSGSLPTGEAVYSVTGGGRPIGVVTADGPVSLDGSDEVLLGEDEWRVYEAFDGYKSASTIASELGIDEYKVRFTALRLLEAGVVEEVAATALPFLDSAIAVPPDDLIPPIEMPDVELSGFEEAAMPTRAPMSARESTLALVPLVHGLVVAVAAIVLLFVGLARPGRILAPLSAEAAGLVAYQDAQRATSFRQIDRILRAHFLLEGRYPDELMSLVDLGVLPATTLYGVDGRSVVYDADEVSYEIELAEGGRPVDGATFRDGITGSFLLDPDFFSSGSDDAVAPLVLLD